MGEHVPESADCRVDVASTECMRLQNFRQRRSTCSWTQGMSGIVGAACFVTKKVVRAQERAQPCGLEGVRMACIGLEWTVMDCIGTSERVTESLCR